MRPLTKKLVRDLGHMWAQALSIALVLAGGVATYVALASSHASLLAARDAFYERSRFPDAFVHLSRAPESVAAELARLPGVQEVSTRLVERGTLVLEGMPDRPEALVVSQPEGDAPLSALALREGRLAEHVGEGVLSEAFAREHGLRPGAELPLVVRGLSTNTRVVGVALSTEHVMSLRPGELMPDPKRFAVVWVPRPALAAPLRMEGAFNDAVLDLAPGAPVRDVLDGLERALGPYGAAAAVGADKQPSNFFVASELSQLASTTRFVPALFFAVAAFLLHVVLGRVVELERQEIATLRALGLSGAEVAWHYVRLSWCIAFVGAAVGLAVGTRLGTAFLPLYEQFFRFPALPLEVPLSLVATAVAGSFVAASLGALSAVRRVLRLQPAQAMRAPAPARFRRSLLDAVGSAMGPSSTMVIREVTRRPARTVLSATALALATGLLVVGRFSADAFEVFLDLAFHRAIWDDVAVSFEPPRTERAVRELAHLPGVLRAEGMRVVPVRFRVGLAARDGVLVGHTEGSVLRRTIGWVDGEVGVPPSGVVLTRKLGELLGVGPGDALGVQVLEGERRRGEVAVAGLVDEVAGLSAHASLATLAGLLGESQTVSTGLLATDPARDAELVRALAARPGVLGVSRRAHAVDRMRLHADTTTGATTLILTSFAMVIAVGVVYNNARIALSTRQRELASLRVLGFTLGELRGILVGELGLQVVLGLPLGFLVGRGMVQAVASSVDPETFRFPAHVAPPTYAFAALTVAVGSAVSSWLVARALRRLDMVEALKTREG